MFVFDLLNLNSVTSLTQCVGCVEAAVLSAFCWTEAGRVKNTTLLREFGADVADQQSPGTVTLMQI